MKFIYPLLIIFIFGSFITQSVMGATHAAQFRRLVLDNAAVRNLRNLRNSRIQGCPYGSFEYSNGQNNSTCALNSDRARLDAQRRDKARFDAQRSYEYELRQAAEAPERARRAEQVAENDRRARWDSPRARESTPEELAALQVETDRRHRDVEARMIAAELERQANTPPPPDCDGMIRAQLAEATNNANACIDNLRGYAFLYAFCVHGPLLMSPTSHQAQQCFITEVDPCNTDQCPNINAAIECIQKFSSCVDSSRRLRR